MVSINIDDMINSILHNMNETDKKTYKMGVEFMKSRVDLILS